jgi:alginate O-acetyltransferase complex protein AlgJ
MRRVAWLVGLLSGGLALAGTFGQFQETGVAEGRNGWLFHVAEYGAYQNETPNDMNEKINLIGAASAMFKQKGIQLVVALVPAKLHVYERELPSDFPLTETIRSRYARALEAMRQQGVNAVDLLTPLMEGKKAKEESQYPVYQRLDHHFSSRGALIAAKAVADVVRKFINIKDLPKVSFKLRAMPPETYQESSLLPRLPAAERAKYKPEAFIPYELQRLSPSAGLLGGNDAKVVLVGSSASKGGRQWPFEYGLPADLSTNVINAAQIGRGPWLPMEDYLRDPSYQTSKPKVVIWQLWEAFLLDVDQSALPQDWGLTLGGLVQDGCTGSSLKAVSSNGYQEFLLGANTNPTNTLVVNLSSPKLEKLRFEVIGASNRKSMTQHLGAVGQNYRLKIPLALDGDTPQRVRLYADTKVLKVSAANSCPLPAAAAKLLEPSPGTQSLITRSEWLELRGFGDIETNGVRWALGQETSVGFWRSSIQAVKLNLDVFNPIEGQEITVLFNNKPLEVWSGLHAGENLQHQLTLNPIRGRNTLALRVKAFNGAGSDFAKGDVRPLSVMFNRFDLSF